MPSKEANLIDALLAISQDKGNQIMERRLADFAVWFYKNKDRIPPENVIAMNAFLAQSQWIMVEIIALQQDRIHNLEDKSRSASLYLPSGVMLNGRKFA